MKVQIVEVGPRDGLQNESATLDVEARLELVERLVGAGLHRIEVGSFVSSKKIPQMASSGELLDQINNSGFLPSKRFSVLVPNEQGMKEAIKHDAKEVAIFTAASESFTRKNINCTIEESFERFFPVLKMAKAEKVKVRAYVSTCFGCPYEGKVNPRKVVEISQRLHKLGVYEISVGDTIGVANPKQVKDMIKRLSKKIPLKKIAMHFHDTRGTALANIYASIESGIRIFDSSVGGLGGCPYAPGSSGNVATEDVVYMLDGLGIHTGIDVQKLIDLDVWISKMINRKLPSKLSSAGLLKSRN